MITRGTIVAVSDDSFIVELQDTGFCNKVMAYENFITLTKIFEETFEKPLTKGEKSDKFYTVIST